MDLEKIAREADPGFGSGAMPDSLVGKDAIERFARLVLEEAARECVRMGPVMCESYGDGAECIATADACAEAIRNLLP